MYLNQVNGTDTTTVFSSLSDKTTIDLTFAVCDRIQLKHEMYSLNYFTLKFNSEVQVHVPQNIRKIYFLHKISRTRF